MACRPTPVLLVWRERSHLPLPYTHLLLSKDKHTPWLDGVPGGQVLPSAELLPILEGLPQAIPRRPGDTDVVPLAITDKQGQLCDLWVATCGEEPCGFPRSLIWGDQRTWGPLLLPSCGVPPQLPILCYVCNMPGPPTSERPLGWRCHVIRHSREKGQPRHKPWCQGGPAFNWTRLFLAGLRVQATMSHKQM